MAPAKPEATPPAGGTMGDVYRSPTARGPADQNEGPLDRGPRRYRLQVTIAAVVAAFAVCLPLLAARDDPAREWGGVVLIGNTLLAALLVVIVGGLLRALGRIRPMAGAFGKGALIGALLGGLLWAVLLIVLPRPPA
jgi:hypothetical protein